MFKVEAKFEASIDDLLGTYESEIDKFALSLVDCVLDAGVAAVTAMQNSHPYTDRTRLLTDGMHCRLGRQTRWMKEAIVQFAAPYAKFVDEGTLHAKPYPFTPQGMAAAEEKLQRCVEQATDVLCRALAVGG